MSDARQPPRIVAAAFFILAFVAATVPLHSYDLFWHLATGRWILEHRGLPAADPFAIASDRAPWVNGEWLFDGAVELLQRMVGLSGLSILRALMAAGLFALIFVLASRSAGAPLAALASAIAFAGANPLLDVRPASLAPLFLVAAIVTARRSATAFVIITILWMNVHPSALLAPLVMLAMTFSASRTLAAAAALLVNPYGWRGIAAPLALNQLVTSGAFTNAEWQRSSPFVFPLLYAAIIAAAVLFIRSKERQASHAILFVVLALLAVLHVRHQPLFFAALPLLLPPAVVAPRAAYGTAFSILGISLLLAPHGVGLSPHRWPVAAVARLKASGLRGNIYNPDQFGGFLIWSFYPERRVLTDGRNELYRTFIGEYARARGDQHAWEALLKKYRIDLAVDEYRRSEVQVVDAVTGKRTLMPASLVYWPRSRWALIAYDESGMVFARREVFAPEVLQRWELRGVVPDAR